MMKKADVINSWLQHQQLIHILGRKNNSNKQQLNSFTQNTRLTPQTLHPGHYTGYFEDHPSIPAIRPRIEITCSVIDRCVGYKKAKADQEEDATAAARFVPEASGGIGQAGSRR
ncbi:hypothetical protein QAD02_006234 [Eretmocerus hayati]|uniref:Uncharacterized protein n=1 Tax=Eretmocerus hayati TaxID=131215 RepID=A0ACC2N2M1_9HYME|nr:hypothetical protein QAD02_006234 [Eretmocerus hayati]